MNTTEMMVICREVDRATGEIAVYRTETEVTESLIFKLRLRARLNPELQYFVTTKAHAARWWVKTPNPNYGKPQAEERQG